MTAAIAERACAPTKAVQSFATKLLATIPVRSTPPNKRSVVKPPVLASQATADAVAAL